MINVVNRFIVIFSAFSHYGNKRAIVVALLSCMCVCVCVCVFAQGAEFQPRLDYRALYMLLCLFSGR
jgi:hypothetical protein